MWSPQIILWHHLHPGFSANPQGNCQASLSSGQWNIWCNIWRATNSDLWLSTRWNACLFALQGVSRDFYKWSHISRAREGDTLFYVFGHGPCRAPPQNTTHFNSALLYIQDLHCRGSYSLSCMQQKYQSASKCCVHILWSAAPHFIRCRSWEIECQSAKCCMICGYFCDTVIARPSSEVISSLGQVLDIFLILHTFNWIQIYCKDS